MGGGGGALPIYQGVQGGWARRDLNVYTAPKQGT